MSDGAAHASPVWKLLGGDLHLHTLSHDYAPAGLLEMVAPSPRVVLDVGCFCGGTGRWLKARFPGVRMVGIEQLAPAAEKARPFYDQLIVAPFEEVDFEAAGLPAGSLDAIVLADVLEHMQNPWQALVRLRPLLAPGGAIYVSLPNVRNLNVLAGLARGEWRYQGSGILDVTHLRFFTRAQAVELLTETGYRPTRLGLNGDPALAEVVKGQDLSQIESFAAGKLRLEKLTQEDVLELLTLQFYFRAEAVA
jgi:2-polyprenyl-3-methyl-5-hydroxy-6-metoxy-1,4-benzoquinol methylase